MNMMTVPDSITTAAPSLASSAMLAELSISVWTARKLDRAATKQTTDAAGAAADAGAFHKKLLSCSELEAVQKYAASVRQTHYSMTMPWSDMGMRLLPTSMFADYYKFITEAEAEFTRLVNEFLQVYSWAQAQAHARLGSMFNTDDYPPTDIVAAKFRFAYAQAPLPDTGDFRCDIGAEAKQYLTTQYEKFYRNQTETAMADVWQRTYDVLARMSERLDYPSSEDKATRKIFRDSLVENVREMTGLLSKFNITGDQKMENMRVQLEHAMAGVSPDALREDDHLRTETKKKVDAVLSAMNW